MLREEVLGKEHLDTLTSMNNLALVLDSQGNYKDSEANSEADATVEGEGAR